MFFPADFKNDYNAYFEHLIFKYNICDLREINSRIFFNYYELQVKTLTIIINIKNDLVLARILNNLTKFPVICSDDQNKLNLLTFI